MPDAERKHSLVQERYFGRSWTHIFFQWKRCRIMLGKTTRRVLRSMPQKSRRVITLGCGPGTDLFEVHDVCSDIEGVQWYGLDLNRKSERIPRSLPSGLWLVEA